MQKSSLLGNSLIWFGAAVSIAEIITGTFLAPLGFRKALAAILIGHTVGCVLLFCSGLIGARNRMAAMECVKHSFGEKGGLLFAVLNLTQLVGWSAVMISAGARSAHGILPGLAPWGWACIIGGLIFLWIVLRAKELKILNTAAITLLFALSLVLGVIIFRGSSTVPAPPGGGLRFGDALELSIAMPLSWLPLIADYTCDSSRPKLVSLLSAGVYFAISCWMYLIGLGAALFAGSSDVTQILSKAGLGVPALLIVVLSTVTTTYLDVYSSEMSVRSITEKIPLRLTGSCVCIAGVLLAVFCSTAAFEGFLYWIGSVFAPMIAIQITDVFILKESGAEQRAFRIPGLAVWAAGFILYRTFLSLELACGSTIPVMLITAVLHVVCRKLAVRR